MRAFHGSLSAKLSADIFRHFGSNIDSSIHRLNSMFASRSVSVFDGEHFNFLDYYGEPKSTATIEQMHDKIIAHFNKAHIFEVDLDIKNQFRIGILGATIPLQVAG